MVLKYLFFACALFVTINKSYGEGETCQFYYNGTKISEEKWYYGIDNYYAIRDVEIPYKSLLFNTSVRHVQEIKSVTVNNKTNKYVNTILAAHPFEENIRFIMALSKNFENYEEEETSIQMRIKVTFLCDNGKYKSLEIRQYIVDSNNHDPEFIPSYYEFNSTTLIPADHFIGKVSARDVDLTNRWIKFYFKSTGSNVMNNFALIGTYRDHDDEKIFHTWLVTTRATLLTQNISFIISSEDSGYNPRHWSAVVDLRIVNNSTTTTLRPTTSYPTTTNLTTTTPHPPNNITTTTAKVPPAKPTTKP